jgi:cbb3-type cytochrome oxidase subunit 3
MEWLKAGFLILFALFFLANVFHHFSWDLG